MRDICGAYKLYIFFMKDYEDKNGNNMRRWIINNNIKSKRVFLPRECLYLTQQWVKTTPNLGLREPNIS